MVIKLSGDIFFPLLQCVFQSNALESFFHNGTGAGGGNNTAHLLTQIKKLFSQFPSAGKEDSKKENGGCCKGGTALPTLFHT